MTKVWALFGLLTAVALSGLLLLPEMETSQAADLTTVEQLVGRHQISAANAALDSILSAGLDDVQASKAWRQKGWLSWRFYRHEEQAREAYRQALSLGREESAVHSDVSRMERHLERPQAAFQAARKALESAQSRSQRQRALEELAAAALAEAWQRATPVLADPSSPHRPPCPSIQSSSRTAAADGDEGKAAGHSPAASRRPLGSGEQNEAAGSDPSNDGLRPRVLEAHRLLSEGLDEFPGALKLARRGVALSLLAGDGKQAWKSWRSYYLDTSSFGERPFLQGPAAQLEAILTTWAGGSLGTPDARMLLQALVDSAFGSEAALATACGSLSQNGFRDSAPKSDAVSRQWNELVAHPAVESLLAYALLTRQVGAATDEYYRLTALGKADKSAWMEDFHRHARDFWKALHGGNGPEYSLARLKEAVASRFRAHLIFGRTNGYQDMHWSHKVMDDSIQVSQYGHSGSFRFISLDGIVSNGFRSWAVDKFYGGKGGTGGWNRGRTIVQIRPVYAGTPNMAWSYLTDPDKNAELRREIESQAQPDLERARRDPHAFLPGLATRLALKSANHLYQDLQSQGLQGRQLQAAFLRAFGEAMFAREMVAHEGRHAIDQNLGRSFAAWELEYRAKLSELIFGPLPFLGLMGMMAPDVGADTPHAKANLKMMQDLTAWMKSNASAIKGLDPTKPLLPQIHLLTESQLRTAARSLDPLAD